MANTGDISLQAERILLDRMDWVPAIELATALGISKRKLRAVRKRPGLCDAFAISSKRGYKHVRFCPPGEYLPRKHTVLRHAVGEIRKVKAWEKSRHRPKTLPPERPAELHTGQLLMPV